LISFGIFALAAGLAEPIEQTGYEIMFFGCHSLRKTLFSTLTSLGHAKFKRSCRLPVSVASCRLNADTPPRFPYPRSKLYLPGPTNKKTTIMQNISMEREYCVKFWGC
jgi:hypothetical protein